MELGCVREKSKYLPRMKQSSTAPSSLQCVLMPPKPSLPHVDDNILNEGLKLVRETYKPTKNNKPDMLLFLLKSIYLTKCLTKFRDD